MNDEGLPKALARVGGSVIDIDEVAAIYPAEGGEKKYFVPHDTEAQVEEILSEAST